MNYNLKMSFQSEKLNTLMKSSQYDIKFECLEQQNKEVSI